MSVIQGKRLEDILAEKGLSMGFVYGSKDGKKSNKATERESKPESKERTKYLMNLYLQSYCSCNVEFTYWYNRKWAECDGEVHEVRRAKALASAYAHSTPSVYAKDLLPGGKTSYIRGGIPQPWLNNSFYLAKEDDFKKAALRSSDAIDDVAQVAKGGGNVTEDSGAVISLAGKFGLRVEHAPVLTKLAHEWIGKSVENLGLAYEQMMEDYQHKADIMSAVFCHANSAYSLPQGREVVSYYYPLEYGLDGMIDLCKQRKFEVAGRADGDGILGTKRLFFYEASRVVLEGIQQHWLNYATELREMADFEEDAEQKAEYLRLADQMEWISHKPPRNFREALHMTYLVHIMTLNEDAISGLSPGRVGQILYPYFEKDIAEGAITEDEVIELLETYRFKFSCIELFVSRGITGSLSGNTFNNLAVGGLDINGRPCGNRLEWLIIHAGMTNPTPQPTLSVLYDERLPEDFLLKCIECTKQGNGYPAWINNRGGMEFLINQYGKEGMTVTEARAIAIGGCLETSPCSWMPLHFNGKTHYIPTGSGQVTSVGIHFINNTGILNAVLFNGKDMRTGIQVFKPHNLPLDSYEQLWETFRYYYEDLMDVLIRANNIGMDLWRELTPSIVNSVLKPDCLEKGRGIARMGTRYNGTYNVETVGTANMVNAFAALKQLVYEEKKYTLDDFREAIMENFGFYTANEAGAYSLGEQIKKEGITKFDDLHGDILKAPKHGNDEDYVKNILIEYENWFCNAVNQLRSLYDKNLYPCQVSVALHAAVGMVTMATPDGRLANTALADGSMSAYPGTDRNGPYALIASGTCWDQSRSQNSQLNMKFHPNAIRGNDGSRKLLSMIRSFMSQGGFHVQFNVVDSRKLKEAQEKPEENRDLLIRVSGFTQYWVETAKSVQDEVIARTEFEGGI